MIPKRIILHHSLTTDSKTVSWGVIRQYHIEVCKWKDIGYHAGIELINNHYEILIGRMLNEIGAHTADNNSDSVGVCFIGNFDKEEPHPEQWRMGVNFVASLCKLFLIQTDYIYGHNYFNKDKTCPGKLFNVGSFKLDVMNKLSLS